MNERRVTIEKPTAPEKRIGPTRVHQLLAQLRDLSYKDFVRLADTLDFEPAELMRAIEEGIEKEKKIERISDSLTTRSAA